MGIINASIITKFNKESMAISGNELQSLAPTLFQCFQMLLASVLATVFVNKTSSSDTIDCTLSTRWRRMFMAKNAAAIQSIQDTFSCCGFKSTQDMAWPFEAKNYKRCIEVYPRTVPCAEKWAEALRKTSGGELGIVLAVGLLQVCLVSTTTTAAAATPWEI
jgi:hypothetical protein